MILGWFWEAKILDFRIFFHVFSKHFSNSILEGEKIEKKPAKTKKIGILGRPGGMCGARGRDREGVIRRSRPRHFELSNLGLKIFGQDFDFGFSTRRHLRWGGGTLRAFRRPHLGCLEA